MASKIDEFCTITGASREIAANLLAACNDSLEMAINMHMEGVDVGIAENSQSSSSSSSSSRAVTSSRKRKAAEDVNEGRLPPDEVDEDFVRAPIPQKRETLVQPGFEGYALRQPNVNRGRVRSVFDGFRNFGNEARSYNEDGSHHTSRSKKRTLEELFKPPLDIMFKGDWQSARDSATAAKKWLIVNIQDAGEFLCQILNRDVWSNEAVRTILREHFLFWQQYKEFEEAQRYMMFYPVTEWPHIAVLDPRTGERLVSWSKVTDSATFCDLITDFLTLHPVFDEAHAKTAPAAASRVQPNTDDDDELSIVDASEDDQLAAAIRASLDESTKPPSRVVREDEDDGADSSDIEAFTTEDEDSNMSAAMRSPIKKTVPSNNTATSSKNGTVDAVEREPSKQSTPSTISESSQDSWLSHLGNESDPKSSIIIRFPDGRKEKKDIPCSSKFTALIHFVVGQGFPLESYEIVTNYPRKVLTDVDENQTLKDLGLFPRETIFVQQRMS